MYGDTAVFTHVLIGTRALENMNIRFPVTRISVVHTPNILHTKFEAIGYSNKVSLLDAR